MGSRFGDSFYLNIWRKRFVGTFWICWVRVPHQCSNTYVHSVSVGWRRLFGFGARRSCSFLCGFVGGDVIIPCLADLSAGEIKMLERVGAWVSEGMNEGPSS